MLDSFEGEPFKPIRFQTIELAFSDMYEKNNEADLDRAYHIRSCHFAIYTEWRDEVAPPSFSDQGIGTLGTA